MSKPVSPLNRDDVYRLALYGVRASGKTCILSALSLPRIAHPDGLSCAWVENPPGRPLSAGKPDSTETADPFLLGAQWMREQRERLRNGKVPAPNPLHGQPLRFLFDFGSPEQGTKHVELIDYSGELIAASASELAGNLREHMRECDGILILAEIPYPGRDQSLHVNDLHLLAGAFRELLNERSSGPWQKWPIALMFNKWDRRTSMAPTDREAEDADGMVQAFLNETPSPPQASLRDSVRNTVGAENCRCFPVSAFGAHEIIRDGSEIPVLQDGRLQSFLLENGFLWATKRCDQLRVEQHERAAKAASWWKFPQLFWGTSVVGLDSLNSFWKRNLRGVSAVRGMTTAWKLRKLFPMDSAERQRLKQAQWRFFRKGLAQLATAVGLAIGAETLYDSAQYRVALDAHRDPGASSEQLDASESWLKDYLTAPEWRHTLSHRLVLDSQEAQQLLDGFRNQRDDAAWEKVGRAADDQTKVKLAREYRTAFPSGKHLVEADVMLADSDRRQQEADNKHHLAQLDLELKSLDLQAKDALDQLANLHGKTNRLPFQDIKPQEIASLQQTLQGQLKEKQQEAIRLIDTAQWQEFEQLYRKLMANRNVAEAAEKLATRQPREARLETLIAEFRKHAPEMIREQVMDGIKNKYWNSAREWVRLTTDANFVRLLDASQLKELQQLSPTIDEAEDRELYGQIKKYQPRCGDQVDQYLSRAPLKSMQREVDAYRQYLERLKGALDLALKLESIDWHEKYSGNVYDYETSDVTVIVNAKKLIEVSDIPSVQGQQSQGVGTAGPAHTLGKLICFGK